ncbi:Cytochrome c oxidase subunit 7A-related protein, mitochondrial, partial [Eschrichtius robustus]|nr:Cytochrome c oxidase subunit 7A-related protein, mitochondrial [Eschrichtius robustus]
GLRPVVSTEAPPIIFATPTKLSSNSTAYEYAGKNKVPELQKFFQVREDTRTVKAVK